ncbi:MAG: ketosteroid isomerase-like protein [Hyphomicrobiaceae bacterium]|jgi:ketosteroid isomerase-like protein
MRAIPNPRVATVIRDYFAALSGRNFATWSILFADDCVVHEPAGTLAAEGRAQLEEVWQIFAGPFETLTIAEDDTFYGGSGAAVHWSATAVGNDGTEAEFEGITVFEIDDDSKITTLVSYWDPADVLIRLAGGLPEEDTEYLDA